MSNASATIFLCGTFRIEDRYGRRVRLQSAKAQGLLALVATSPKAERSRAWLQSMLWSERGPEQASASLRQALTQLRKILRPAGVLIDTDRRRVALDLTTVRIVESGPGELLEGLDVRDEAFEDWLTTERSHRFRESETKTLELRQRSPDAGSWSLAIIPQSAHSDGVSGFELLFADSLARNLRELYTAPIQVGPAEVITGWSLVARIQCFVAQPGSVSIRVSIDHPAVGHQIWAGFRELHSEGVPSVNHPDLQQMAHELVDALGDYLILSGHMEGGAREPDRLFRQAIRALFSMDPKRVAQADTLLAQAYDWRPRGLYLAWRMQLRAIQLIEKHPIDEDGTIEEGRSFYAQALELEPNNSMVLATLANSLRRIERDDSHSLYLAQRSVSLNPMNSFAWQALSSASNYVGDVAAAYRSARAARHMATLSPHRFWWDSQVCSAALLVGRIGVALKFAEATHVANPGFRPPLRYLVALHASEGNVKESLRAAEKLKRLEPDFTIERLLRDESYPASLIHSAPNINKERIASLL